MKNEVGSVNRGWFSLSGSLRLCGGRGDIYRERPTGGRGSGPDPQAGSVSFAGIQALRAQAWPWAGYCSALQPRFLLVKMG